MKLGLFSGVAASALVAMIGTASAATFTSSSITNCPGCTITVTTSGSDYTPPSPLPFTPLDLGTGSGDGLQSSNMINTPGGGISSISFSNGTPTSGLYAGNTVGVALSPFGGNGSGSPDPLNNYLVAGGTNGSVTIIYSAPQTSLDLLWGTVDPNPVDYNQMVFQAGTQTLTGADIDAITGNILTAGAEDVAVQITGLTSFTTLTANDTASPSFEFTVAAVPAPPIGHGLPVLLAVGGMLFGGGLLQRGRKWLATVIPEAGAV